MKSSFYDILRAHNVLVSSELKTHELYDLLLALYLVEENATRNKQYGILGWDIAFTPSHWVESITGSDWDPRLNPILLKNNTWVHHSGDVSGRQINRAISILRAAKKDGQRRWQSFLPRVIELHDDEITEPFQQLIEDPQYHVAMVGWKSHMRFVYKENDRHLSFFDPWMQDVDRQEFFSRMQEGLEETYGYSSAFIRRQEDQSEENSCVIDSLARCLMIAEYNEEAAFWPWDESTFDYALMAARIIHIIVTKEER